MRVWAAVVGLIVAGCGEDKLGTAETVPDGTTAPDVVIETTVDVTQETIALDTAEPETKLETSAPEVDTSAPETVADVAIETADTAIDTAPEVATETTVTPPKEVRFVALGDTGEGNERQRKVAEQIRLKCLRDGCDFAILMGDNIYDAGVESTFDAQWQDKFEAPFANVNMPFYAVLGNHDNGGFLTQWLGDVFGGAGAEFERGDYQVAYTQYSNKWKMPGRTYDFAAGPAHFFALDTNDMVWSYGNEGAEARTQWQVDTIPGRIDAASATWKIAFGHHPYLSNGTHGDAGTYEGLEEGITDLVVNIPGLGDLSAVVTGDGVKESLDTIVCGRVDIYFAGHDHSRQWHAPSAECPGTTFVVSGAGAKMTEIKGNHPVLFQNVTKAGFFWVHLEDNTISVEAIDEDGTSEWTWQGSK